MLLDVAVASAVSVLVGGASDVCGVSVVGADDVAAGVLVALLDGEALLVALGAAVLLALGAGDGVVGDAQALSSAAKQAKRMYSLRFRIDPPNVAQPCSASEENPCGRVP